MAHQAQPQQQEDKDVIHHVEAHGQDMVEEIDHALAKGQPVLMKSSLDRMTVWQAAAAYKKTTLLCMAAAFSASLDGYQINLNGSIVANKGFIATMTSPGQAAINGPYVSAWGGIQSTGQFIGQMIFPTFTDKFGRKIALYAIWLICALSVVIESVTKNWWTWLIAKLFAGIGVGSLQATLPVYISEHSPTQLRGFLINAYTFWFVVGQLMAPVALNELNATHPYDFKTAIYTQWAMIGITIIIYVFLPESPWWLVSKSKLEQAEKVLVKYNGHVADYDVHEEIGIMVATVEQEERVREATKTKDILAIFRGTNGWRLLIALWPKLMQQFVGLSVFNSYSTYFFQLAGNKQPFQVTVILACVQLISCIIFATCTDAFGRRPLTIYPYCVCTVAVLGLGIVGCFDYTSYALGSLLIFFACVAIFTCTGASAIGYAYLAEIPQQHLRARTSGWGLAITNLFGIMFSFTVPLMLKGAGNGGPVWGVKTGFFFAGTGLVVCVIGWFIIPEVAQRTPAEINELFEKKVSPRKFKGYLTDVQMTLEEKERVQEAAVA
ncbi:hypothetical protein EHS25_002310 [Saitozyma podzolica]|uniref:Major facilitator superfamily (MFS) profile domain-containing protein n=1 Tax=Saitozyma podzolica TaxID=1890683 RepID=A0A427YDP1_9TREE|nr:hypothetical protein EHS25_002310 [Saitozyma podzolica]